MTLDRIMELAQKVSEESDAKRRETTLGNLIQRTSDKIPCLTGTIDREINLFNDFVLQDFFKIDFVGRDDEGRSYYRQGIREINSMLCNFLIMDINPLLNTITANVNGDKMRFGWCASLLYMALRNEQRRLQEENDLFSIAEDESKDKPEITYSKKLLSLFNDRVDLIRGLHGSDFEIATQIKELAKQKDSQGEPLIEHPDNRRKTSYAKELKKAHIIKLSERTFRGYL